MIFSAVNMLAEIERIVSFGIRRPGYDEGLRTEQHLLDRFNELGLSDTRFESVPVNYWQSVKSRLSVGDAATDIPCFAVPYTGWTAGDGAQAGAVYVGVGGAEAFDEVDVSGKIVVADMQFGELNASHLKGGAHFIHDPGGTIPDGPLHCANWLIPNFRAYYESWKRSASGFIGLLGEMPVDGCELYVPYDGFLKKTPAAWVGREHVEAVRSAAVGGKPFHFTSTGEGRLVDSHNVVGVLPGRTDEFILLTCHHDAPFASAVEDASGLSVLLALAEVFAQSDEPLERGLVFLAASGHFHGGIGCREFVAKHRGGLLEKIVAAIGVEHIAEEAQGDANGGYVKTGQAETRALFMDKTPELLRVVEEEVQRVDLSRTLAVDAYLFGSEPPCDSAPFFTAGIPSVCHISGPLYLFDPHDTIDMVREEDLPKVADLFQGVIRRIDSIPAVDLAKGTTRQRTDPPPAPPPWFLPPETFLGE
ncbi:MAG: M28 family peptidase [Verrucomicrobiota bacterium]|nr:M28 family peptidase [Verrucomicrobiota bacterium]